MLRRLEDREAGEHEVVHPANRPVFPGREAMLGRPAREDGWRIADRGPATRAHPAEHVQRKDHCPGERDRPAHRPQISEVRRRRETPGRYVESAADSPAGVSTDAARSSRIVVADPQVRKDGGGNPDEGGGRIVGVVVVRVATGSGGSDVPARDARRWMPRVPLARAGAEEVGIGDREAVRRQSEAEPQMNE